MKTIGFGLFMVTALKFNGVNGPWNVMVSLVMTIILILVFFGFFIYTKSEENNIWIRLFARMASLVVTFCALHAFNQNFFFEWITPMVTYAEFIIATGVAYYLNREINMLNNIAP